MQRLEVSGAVRLLYGSLGFKGLIFKNKELPPFGEKEIQFESAVPEQIRFKFL